MHYSILALFCSFKECTLLIFWTANCTVMISMKSMTHLSILFSCFVDIPNGMPVLVSQFSMISMKSMRCLDQMSWIDSWMLSRQAGLTSMGISCNTRYVKHTEPFNKSLEFENRWFSHNVVIGSPSFCMFLYFALTADRVNFMLKLARAESSTAEIGFFFFFLRKSLHFSAKNTWENVLLSKTVYIHNIVSVVC